MMSQYLVIILLIFLIEISIASKKASGQNVYKPYILSHFRFSLQPRVYFAGVQCKNFDRKLLSFLECFMLPDNQNKLMLNLQCKFGQELVRDFKVNIGLFAELNDRNLSYRNLNLDVCEDLASPKNHLIVRLF